MTATFALLAPGFLRSRIQHGIDVALERLLVKLGDVAAGDIDLVGAATVTKRIAQRRILPLAHARGLRRGLGSLGTTEAEPAGDRREHDISDAQLHLNTS